MLQYLKWKNLTLAEKSKHVSLMLKAINLKQLFFENKFSFVVSSTFVD
jgi:hypothetical protein